MSVAYFITLDSDDPGFDAFVDGKVLTRHVDSVNAIAADIGLKQFEDYAFQDLSEFGGPDMDEQWFDAAEGIAWATALRAHLRNHPGAVGDAAGVIEDLDDYIRVFEEAESRGLKWHLELDL